MTYDLEEVELFELSLVDNPANQHASVVLFKRSGYKDGVKPKMQGDENEGDGQVTVEELTKNLEALQAQVTDLTKKAEDAETAKATAEAAAEALTKSAEDAGLDIEDGKIVKRADPEYVEIDGERVEKSLVPAPVLKAIEKQAAAIAKMEAAAADVELAKRGAADLPNIAGTDLAKGKLLAAVGEDEDMLKALKAADAAMAGNFVEKGTTATPDDDSPAYKLETMAKAKAAADGVSFETAYAALIQSTEGRDIYKALRAEAN